MKYMYIGLFGLCIATSSFAGGVMEFDKDLDSDHVKERYILKLIPEIGTELYVDKNSKLIKLTKNGVLPVFYKIFDLPIKNCIRIGADESDDFYDMCWKNQEYQVVLPK